MSVFQCIVCINGKLIATHIHESHGLLTRFVVASKVPPSPSTTGTVASNYSQTAGDRRKLAINGKIMEFQSVVVIRNPNWSPLFPTPRNWGWRSQMVWGAVKWCALDLVACSFVSLCTVYTISSYIYFWQPRERNFGEIYVHQTVIPITTWT